MQSFLAFECSYFHPLALGLTDSDEGMRVDSFFSTLSAKTICVKILDEFCVPFQIFWLSYYGLGGTTDNKAIRRLKGDLKNFFRYENFILI